MPKTTKTFSLYKLEESLGESVSNKIWKEIAQLQAMIELKGELARPENWVTTSIYLTGNQILLGLSKKSLEEMVKRAVSDSIYEANLESKDIERIKSSLVGKQHDLDFQIKQVQVKNLIAENQRLENRLIEIEEKITEINELYE